MNLENTADYEARYAKLIAKIEQLYGIGIRKFDVLNDDFGSGSHDTVVTVLNRLNRDLKEKGCEPLVYCPQGYNQSWSGNGTELAALKNLDEDINIYWTGADVNAPITQETVDFLTERSNHKPNFWLNYPVNEHAKSGIFLGDITYYARDHVSGLAGFHSNPCRFAYANEIGLYQLAALVWNNANYSEHAQEVWESAFDYLQPEVKDSYFTIASNIANAPNSTRVPGFNESEYLKDKLAAVQALLESKAPIKANAEAQEVLEEFKNMIAAVKDFRENCANKGLVNNLEPWLKSLDDLAHAGVAALESIMALEEQDVSTAWVKLSSASKYYDTMYTYLSAEDLKENPAKAGSKRLEPFVTKAIHAAKNQLTPILNPDDDTASPTLYARMGGVVQPDDANGKKLYDGDETTIAGWQIIQKAGDYYGLDFGRSITVRDISVLQGQNDTHHDIFHDAVLQYSEDGAIWTDIDASVDGMRITADGLNLKARYVRYYLKTTGFNGKPDYWTFVREFTVNKKTEEHDRVYTNVDSLKTTPLTLSGAEISVRDLKSVRLEKGQYIGMKLANPSVAEGFVKDAADETGLTFECSYNETEWITVPKTVSDGIAVKYVRLINKTDSPVTTDIGKLGVLLNHTTANPKVKEHNLANALQEGSFDNLFDGDLSTFAWTNEQQKTGQYITVDLGNQIKVYDVQIVTTDGNPRFYNAEIQLSADNSNWTTIAKVENDNSVFEVPYRYVRADAKGQNARYLRIYLTGNSGYYLKLHEIEVNKNVESQNTADTVVSNLNGSLSSIADGNITTLLAADAVAGSYVEYRISDNTNVNRITVVQGQEGHGKVIAKTLSGDVELGVLDKSVAIFDTSELDAVTAVRLEWDEAEKIAIHEIFLSKGKNVSDDIGQYVEPIIDDGTEEPKPEEPVNIALGKEVVSNGCEIADAANEGNVNDGDINTRWDSVHLKGSDIHENAWIYIDLGEDKQYEISKIVAKYYNKVYPTDYELQVSDDAQRWETVETVTKADNGAAHPVDTFELEEVLTSRYVRLFFRSVNAGAGGNGVAVTEFEIYGMEKKTADKTELQNAVDRAKEKTTSKEYTAASKAALKAAIEEAQAVLDNKKATAQDVSDALTALEPVVAALQRKVTESANIGLEKPISVSGTSNGVKESINDADTQSKWDSNFIKASGLGQTAWFVIDLGEQTNLIDGLKVDYFNKVYPTRYEVQVSNDHTNWTTVKRLSREHSTSITYPKDDILFETPVSARYIKMLFTEMNEHAAGHGIGITNAEVIGRYVYETTEVFSAEKVPDIVFTQGEVFDETQLPETVAIQFAVAEWEDKMTALVPAAWNTETLDMENAGNYSLTGTLSLNGIANDNAVQAKTNIIVQGKETAPEYIVSVNGVENVRGVYNKKVTVTAEPAAEGQVFAGWSVDGKMVSTDAVYTFYISNSVNLIPVYVEAEDAKQEPGAVISNALAMARPTDNKSDIRFVGQLVIPKGYTLRRAGLVWTTKTEKKLIVDGGWNPELTPTYISAISNTNQFSVTIKGLPQGMFIRGIIFAELQDGEGNTVYAFSDEKKVNALQ